MISAMQIVAWIASLCVFTAFFMKTMVRLRIIAIASNIVFITYGLVGMIDKDIFWNVFPILVLHSTLLPINFIRLRQERNLVSRIRVAGDDEEAVHGLIPYMKKIKVSEGSVLFRRGDPAEHIYYIHKGKVEIPEVYKQIGDETLFGEIGVFTPGATRTAGAICIAKSDIYRIHKDKVFELFYQNPKFGFFIVRLLAKYAGDNVNNIVPPGTPVAKHLKDWKMGMPGYIIHIPHTVSKHMKIWKMGTGRSSSGTSDTSDKEDDV